MLQKEISDKLKMLEDEITSLGTQISQLPEGKLVYVKNGDFAKFYVSDGSHSRYIPKKNISFAQLMAYKKLLKLKKRKHEAEKKCLQKIVSESEDCNSKYEEFIQDAHIKKLLEPFWGPSEQSDKEWMQARFDRNPFKPEQLVHDTVFGLKVRSKSESLIAVVLAECHIPFRYECKLDLNGHVVYPDFTIRTKSGKIVYWEHFGRMDEAKYYHDNLYKIRDYISSGIVPSNNLIVTFEAKNYPLTYEMIMNTIRTYFL